MVDNIRFPAQFYSFRASTIGDRIISFRVDEMYAEQIKDLVSVRMGTEYIITLIKTEQNMEDELKSLKERLYKKMHILIHEYSDKSGENEKKVKDVLKSYLKSQGAISESTKELDTKGVAMANNKLEEWISKQIPLSDILKSLERKELK